MLCKHNPNKRCTGNFAHKYWVGDKLLAKCEGEIQVELVDGTTGERVMDDLSNIRLEVRPPNKQCPSTSSAELGWTALLWTSKTKNDVVGRKPVVILKCVRRTRGDWGGGGGEGGAVTGRDDGVEG